MSGPLRNAWQIVRWLEQAQPFANAAARPRPNGSCGQSESRPMPKRIILHLGLHKTATTSLQDFLTENIPALLRHGVRFIPLQRMRTDVTPLFWAIDKGRRNKLVEFIDAVEQDTLLLSDENMIGVPGELTQGGVYPYARNRVVSFCEDLKDLQITIFLTLREPQWFITSMYSEYLRHNDFIPFEGFIAALDCGNFSFRKAFSWLGSLPENAEAKIIPFEADHGGGVVRTAEQIIAKACGPASGIDLAKFPNSKSRSSYTTEEIRIAAEIANSADPQTSKFFLNMIDFRERRFGTTKFTPFPAGTAERMLRNYREDLQYFKSIGC